MTIQSAKSPTGSLLFQCETPELPNLGTGTSPNRKMMSSAKASTTDEDFAAATAAQAQRLYSELLRDDTKLNATKTSAENKEPHVPGNDSNSNNNGMFTFDFVLPLADVQKPSFFSHDFNELQGYCPCSSCSCCCSGASLECAQGLPEPTISQALQHVAVCSRRPKQSTAKKGESALLCDAIAQRSEASDAPMAEVPVLAPERRSLPKADFGSAGRLPFPPAKALESLFARGLEEYTSSLTLYDTAPRDWAHTAPAPVSMLFQPVKVPEVPRAKTSSFDLLKASSGRLLEENKDHQLFGAFLEPYWNSDRLFSLKAVLLCDSFPPVAPKKPQAPPAPPALRPIAASLATQERAEQEEEEEEEEPAQQLSVPAGAPLPEVLSPAFTVDDSLSEFMRIRGKAPGGAGTSTAPVTTPLRRTRKRMKMNMEEMEKEAATTTSSSASEKKGFFDIGCVVCLSEGFPLYPVVSRFLERHAGRALWVLSSSSPYESLLCSLFRSRALTTVTLGKAREPATTAQLAGFSLVIASLSAVKSMQQQGGGTVFGSGKQQRQSTEFLVLCDTGPESILECRDLLGKTLGVLYALGNNSPAALDAALHRKVLPVEVPSSVAKVAATAACSGGLAGVAEALALQDFDAALAMCTSPKDAKLRRDVEILRLEAEAGLFANSAADAFTSGVLPVLGEALRSCEDKALVVANSCVERSYALKYIPEGSAVFACCGSGALPPKETLEKVKAVLRFSCSWDGHKGSRLLSEHLYFHLVHLRKDAVPFLVVELSLGVHAQKHTATATTTTATATATATAITNWWNSQDLQRAIYTAHFPSRLAFFFPIAQLVRATPKRIASASAPAPEAGQSKPRRVILSARRGTLLKFGHLFQSNERYAFAERPSAARGSICFAHTGLLSGVVVVLSKAFSKEHRDAVGLLVRDSGLECVTLLVWRGVSTSGLGCLGERAKVLFFEDDSSLKALLDFALTRQVQHGASENSWVLDDETPNERFLVSLGLSSLAAQFVLASLSLGQVLTLEPTAICRRTGAPFLAGLKFFRVLRCAFERKPPRKPPQTQRGGPAPVYQPVSPIKASPTKRARVFYELPKGDVLGQARLRICSLDECANNSIISTNSTGGAWAGFVAPKHKAPKITAASSPTKRGGIRQKNCSREELCSAISRLYEYKGEEEEYGGGEEEEEDDDDDEIGTDVSSARDETGSRFNRAQSPQKQKQKQEQSSPVFTANGKRLTIPEFTLMRRFPQLPLRK